MKWPWSRREFWEAAAPRQSELEDSPMTQQMRDLTDSFLSEEEAKAWEERKDLYGRKPRSSQQEQR